MKLYKKIYKPLFDLTFASLAFFLALIPGIIIAITLRIIHGSGGVFFIQDRPGKDGKVFKLFKFKTMSDARGKDGDLLPDEERITSIGRFIRKTSLDELPQLINVLKGDMSLIGPRPLLIQYLSLYTKEQSRRHEIKPGITGWAQVNGRNAISWENKFRLDVWYVDNISWKLDIKILLLTIKKVFNRHGISADDHATMEYFKGKTDL